MLLGQLIQNKYGLNTHRGVPKEFRESLGSEY